MDLENKEEIIQPVNDEELENASGGKIQFDRYRYHCNACNYTGFSCNMPAECPRCHGKLTITERPNR